MRLIRKLWDWLTSPSSSAHKKGHPDLYPLDVEKLAQELNIVEEAKRLGEAGHPSADAVELTGTERHIVQRVEKARQDYVDWAVLRLRVLSEDISSRNVTQDIGRARKADEEFTHKANALIGEKESLLRTLYDGAVRLRSELEAFKSKNNIINDARYPTPAGSFMRYSLLVVMVMIEGAVNAAFFAEGVSTGLIGGFLWAAGLAAFNVVVAFLFGKFLIPNINHISVPRKVLGIVSVVAALAVMVTVGLGIAHMRDALTAGAADPTQEALRTLLANPIDLRDIFSWLLFGISVLFALGAMIDGLSSDDPYPGYGAISRRSLEASEEYEHELKALRTELEELKDDRLKALDKTAEDSQTALSLIASLIDDKRVTGSRLSNALCDADNSLSALLGKFRTENQLHRGGERRPAYFDTRPTLPILQLPNFDTSSDESSLNKQRKFVDALIAELQALRSRIQAAYSQQYDRLKPLDVHFSEKEEI